MSTSLKSASFRERVNSGLAMEALIADAIQAHGLKLEPATHAEDCERGIDRWLLRNGKRQSMQIKYRETGSDLLFEVYGRFYGWDNPNNKKGRDMKDNVQLYAVLMQDRQSIAIVPCAEAKKVLSQALVLAAAGPWTSEEYKAKTFCWTIAGVTVQVKAQVDHRDVTKLITYIPSEVFANHGLETIPCSL